MHSRLVGPSAYPACNPYASLIFDNEGALYGTTTSGGSAGNYGTVFKVTFP
jgi:uncharacterized repeat protein (TIGR03803 family)